MLQNNLQVFNYFIDYNYQDVNNQLNENDDLVFESELEQPIFDLNLEVKQS